MTQQLSQERFLSNTYSFTCNMQYCQACEMYICVPLHAKNIFWMFWDLQDQKQASYRADGQLHGWLDWKGCKEWQEQAARQNRQIKIYIGQKKQTHITIPHSTNSEGSGYKLSPQWFLGLFGWTSISYDWLKLGSVLGTMRSFDSKKHILKQLPIAA